MEIGKDKLEDYPDRSSWGPYPIAVLLHYYNHPHARHFEPEMVFIKGGTFMMGSPPDEAERRDDEGPVHEVMLSDFYMGKYEVTFAQYDAFCDATGKSKLADNGWGRGDMPVIYVNWHDAKAYCEWLSKETGKTYRLPTEAEWEYACRAGSTTRYWNGDDSEDLALIGNVADAKAKAQFPDWKWTIGASDGYLYTAPVGKFSANGFGLHDMHGRSVLDAYFHAFVPGSNGENRVKTLRSLCAAETTCVVRNVQFVPAIAQFQPNVEVPPTILGGKCDPDRFR